MARCIKYLGNTLLDSTQRSTCVNFAKRLLTMSMTMAQDLTVLHDSNHQQFYIILPDQNGKSQKALLDYDWQSKNVMDLHHTEVPVELRGKGIATYLAKAAFDYAVENDKKMILTCTYLQKYARETATPQHIEQVLKESS